MILGLMVTRNEEHRFLTHALASLREVTQRMFVYDDQSTDHTAREAWIAGARIEVRPDTVPPFAEHEGQFRDAAWQAMEARLDPQPGDWIFALDADQLVVGGRRGVDTAVEIFDGAPSVEAVRAPVDELWQMDPPMARIDGYWGRIFATCLYRWQPGRHIADKPLACGSVPPVVPPGPAETSEFRIRHLGYVRATDRREKYDRYVGRKGHSQSHIQSILTAPSLIPAPIIGGT